MNTGKFIKNTKYYTGIVYEWNLPAGWSCPFAKECKVKVDRDDMIERRGLKSARVYASPDEVPEGMPIDNNDDWARVPDVSFALLDNFKNKKKG